MDEVRLKFFLGQRGSNCDAVKAVTRQVAYAEITILAMAVEEAEVNALAANAGQLGGHRWAEGCVVDGPQHALTGEHLEGAAAPHSHCWI